MYKYIFTDSYRKVVVDILFIAVLWMSFSHRPLLLKFFFLRYGVVSASSPRVTA